MGAWFWCVQIEILKISSTCTHQWRWAFSCLCILSANMWFGRSLSSMAFSLHDARNLIIEISTMCQSILGLCSMPHVPWDNHSSADAGDMEFFPFRVILILDYQVDNLSDMSGFIGGPSRL